MKINSGYMVVLFIFSFFFFFNGTSILFSIVAVSIYIFNNNARGFSGGQIVMDLPAIWCKTQNSGLCSKEEKLRDPISQSSRCNAQEGLLSVAQTG